MSLPNASKDISSNPSANAVTEPIDRQKLQTDVDRKLRLYGVFTAIKQSRLPTNDQIDSILSHISHGSLSGSDSLSPDGQKLVQDSHDIIETLRKLVAEKNADELLQNFFWHTRDVNVDAAKKDPNDVIPVQGDKVRSDGQTAAQHLRTLLSLVFTNAEVRKLFADFAVVGRDLLARGAEKVAEHARPGDEALRGIDAPAPAHQFVSEGGRKVGPEETPVSNDIPNQVPEVQVPGTDVRVAHHPRADDPAAGTAIKHGDQVTRGDEALDEAQHRKEELKGQAQMEAALQKSDVKERAAAGQPIQDEADAQTRKRSLQEKWGGVKDTLRGRVPDEHKDHANEQTQRVKNFLSDEYFPEERRDQFIFRLKKVVYECQSHKDYQGSMQWLLNFLEEYASHGRTIAEHGKDSHQELSSDPNLQTSLREIRTLLERFANGRSLDTIGDAFRALYADAQEDERLRHWFRDVDAFVREALLQPGYILEDQSTDRANELRDSGRHFYDDKYKGHFDNLISSVQSWFGAIAEDPLNKQIGNNFAQLAKDLFFDGDGNLKFKPELWADIRQQIIPGFIDQVGYVPIPRIEYTDEAVDLVIENLALSGKNLFPNLITMEARNFAKLSGYKNIKDEFHHEFTLTLGQVQADMRDVAFYFRKKTGTPKLTDSGLADILLGGSGLTVTVHLVSADKDRSSVFHVKDVATSIHTLKFAVRDSKHDTLYKLLAPLASGLVKKQLQKAVAAAVRTALEYVDGQLVAVRDQVAQARAGGEDGAPRDALREQLAARKEQAARAKANKDARGAQFKVVSRPGDELLPHAGHPDGWVNRAQEHVDAAGTGEEWRSEAYSNVV
ncbi:hypothetical protein BC628DRAFT_1498440 [Trametes gibbosa]|nr:hypothetical protein BC628DRAFT_1498440 [Trametes gibbosa]